MEVAKLLTAGLAGSSMGCDDEPARLAASNFIVLRRLVVVRIL